jgi:hypothetical protein
MRFHAIGCKSAAVRLTIYVVLAFARQGMGRPQNQEIEAAAVLPEQAQPESNNKITAVPNRPTFSTTAETVMRGVFEIECGFDLASGHQDINGLLKFGLTKTLEIRLGNNPIVRSTGIAGFGDSGVGFKYRFLKDKKYWPTFSVLYTLTIPTAAAGVGSGVIGHSAGLLVSRDFGRHHLDFNENIQWLGRENSGGFDHNYFTALSYSHPITEKFGFSEELAGFSRTNTMIGPTLTLLQALTYSASSRLVLDGGCYFGLMGDLPQVTFFGGVTYAVVDLYRRLHRRHH